MTTSGEDFGPEVDCSSVPSVFSSFVDTFVDFVVGGQVLGSQQSPTSSGALKENGVTSPVVTRVPAAERVIAVGDLHGDLEKAKEAMMIAEVMDANEKWMGGKTVVVQVGDVLDRGGEELKILYLLEKLKGEAMKQGGDVHIMNGNHEIMNIEGDFRYVDPKGFAEFGEWAKWYRIGNALKEQCKGLEKPPDFFKDIPTNLPENLRARLAALRPGGPISSRFLAAHPTVLIVGQTVFVHGGLLPKHIDRGLEKINDEVRRWILGEKNWLGPSYLHGRQALVWLREYSKEQESVCDCGLLEETLKSITGAQRMVVGHTIQEKLGINAVCNNKVVRVDVGMSKGCGNFAPEVLELRDDKELTVLTRSGALRMMNDEEIAALLRKYKVIKDAGTANFVTSSVERNYPNFD
ncbi:hypothetical protein R1sor_021027 [Riccia sorocarpa]|uniref:Calcineurin-like phosphoesterase domain-containing protein n=1 Tax=Riccia sorocarpa TaxID=122646 RepID=A0ABD3GJJ5_9MARC